MSDTTTTVADRARRLIRAATGEEWGDGLIVTDIAADYAEPGYSLTSEDGLIVFGNWNTTRHPREGDAPLTLAEKLPARLADALARVGADLEWLDEWTTCEDCGRAMRTQPDSYSWKMYGAWQEDCGYVCAECLLEDIDGALGAGGYIDNPRNAVTWANDDDLTGASWTRWEPGNPQTYETGWHPSQDDDPQKVYDEIRRVMGEDVSVVFVIDSTGQFDCRWGAYVKAEDVEASA